MSACTIFKHFTTPVEDKSLIIISNWIASDKFKIEIEEIRLLIEQGDKEKASDKKKQLLAFTPSGVFKEKRLLPNLERYTQFLHLDFDKLTSEQLQDAFQVISNIPYTFLCFVSPSGNGLKVFIEVDTGVEHHETAYLQVQKCYEDATGLKADPSCKDITRLCFMSYDPTLYKNLNYEKFKVELNELESNVKNIKEEKPIPNIQTQHQEEQSEDLNAAFIFNQQIQFTNLKSEYTNGNRNNYMYLLASNCNRAGLSESDTYQYCIQNFDLSQMEIQKSVRSAYNHHLNEFAKFANSASFAKPNKESLDDELEIDYLKNTPTIPDEVFEKLPDLLKRGSAAFNDRRKRDVFFTGALSILSGCLPKVSGVYAQERVYPHLYTFVIAPAASGKGVLKNAKRLADKYHAQVVEESRILQKTYESEMLEYKNQQHKAKKGDVVPDKPDEPPFKIVFIPANCSQARIIEHLQANDGQGIICETEADTMSSTKKQDWGDYSTIMRQAFHHEKISLSRKTNNEFTEVLEPRLAIALTGTPAQAPKLIASAEDGLFSRFVFYAYKNEIEWQDPSPKTYTLVFNDYFDQLATELLHGIDLLNQSPTQVELTNEQWRILNDTFKIILSEVTIYTSVDAASLVFRLGLISYRISMILTALRKIENAEFTDNVFCSDVDFDNTMLIIKTYLQHNILMFNNLPKQNDSLQFYAGDHKRKLFEELPNEFSRKEAIELGKSLNLSPRTTDVVLKVALGKSITKIKAGYYQKI
ncbi:MAG TPA: DUF3987 domain-containing protein [Chitinophagales bacterium]|nr:DUF3987 domain-containing protein [Chitinophagales bacterium]